MEICCTLLCVSSLIHTDYSVKKQTLSEARIYQYKHKIEGKRCYLEAKTQSWESGHLVSLYGSAPVSQPDICPLWMFIYLSAFVFNYKNLI